MSFIIFCHIFQVFFHHQLLNTYTIDNILPLYQPTYICFSSPYTAKFPSHKEIAPQSSYSLPSINSTKVKSIKLILYQPFEITIIIVFVQHLFDNISNCANMFLYCIMAKEYINSLYSGNAYTLTPERGSTKR